MDELENSLFDLPDYENTEDENFPPLPAPRSPGGLDDDDDWTKNMGKTQPEEEPKPARRVMKRPQPKLDAQRLTSQRGLPALRHLFDGTKFKGKGHEAEDLKVLIRQMENWAHRLFPKLQFEDFLNRLEILGNKKEVQTCLKRIRMDLPILHEDFNSEEVVVQMEENSLDLPGVSELPESSPPPRSQPRTAELSEETLQRIERNRQLALEKRMQKMQAQAASQAETQSLSQTPASEVDDIPEDFDADLTEALEEGATSSLVAEGSPAGQEGSSTEMHVETEDQ